MRAQERTVGVISVDPSSPFTQGALLGDRIRLTDHFLDPGVFIRSMGTRGHLGGLAEATLQALLVLDAAGKDVVFLETVGAGQSEVEVIGIADTVLLVLMPGSGDSIQALKAGIMEIPDVIAINKMDHPAAKTMLNEVRPILALDTEREWKPPIVLTEAMRGEDVRSCGRRSSEHRAFLETDGGLDERRRRNLAGEVFAVASARAKTHLERAVRDDPELRRLLDEVQRRELDPLTAVREIMEKVFKVERREQRRRLADIEAARARLAGIARVTPVYGSETLSRAAGREVWLKAENLQRTGSFKIRGAGEQASSLLSDAERAAGVVAASAGNHGQAVAWAAREAGIEATDLHAAGRADGEGRGDAELRRADRARRRDVRRRARGRAFVRRHERRDLRAPVRGRARDRRAGNDRARARRAAARRRDRGRADRRRRARGGRRVGRAGAQAVGAHRRGAGGGVRAVRRRDRGRLHDRGRDRGQAAGRADRWRSSDDRSTTSSRSTDEEISKAIVLLLERAKLVVEGAGAAPVAALLADRVGGSGPVAVLLSGGNIDADALDLGHAPRADARRPLPRRAARACPTGRASSSSCSTLIAQERVNVVSVEHHREGMHGSVAETEVELTLATRDKAHGAALLEAMERWGYPAESVR